MDEISKQSDYYQSRMNDAKMGAYYTDPKHCRMIHGLLQFPEEEVCCLEPSIGDGNAVLEVVGKKRKEDSLKVYGVELEREVMRRTSSNPLVNECICADFLSGVVISHNSFSFAFMNPPYGVTRAKKRMETEFLGKVTPYLKKDAVLVVVIPRYVAADFSFLGVWCKHYETQATYRFHEEEYKKWKQVVLLGRKTQHGTGKEGMLRLQKELEDEGAVPLLPERYDGEKIPVAPSKESEIKQYSTRAFDADKALGALRNSPLYPFVKEKTRCEPYRVDRLGRPPILPCNGQMYLLAVTGGGQGLVGSVENRDLHIQRGIVKIETNSEVVMAEDGGKCREVVTSFPQVSFKIVENDGTISVLR